MLKARFQKHTLVFKFDAGTSRGILKEKEVWFVFLWEEERPYIVGIGECSILKGLSLDDRPDYEQKLGSFCKKIHFLNLETDLKEFPSIHFGIETALLDLKNKGVRKIFENSFFEKGSSIPINGLIWMGTKEFMLQQIEEKLKAGFTCLKMKIGAIDFEVEKEVLSSIRKRYPSDKIMLRLDANGAFAPNEALDKLYMLSDLDIHSIEQPIRQRQIEEMARLCHHSPIPIALDEELIGSWDIIEKQKLLQTIKPHYIIIKPSLLGGFEKSNEWITTAEKQNIGWWITSALESNIGLNAICQYTYEKLKGNEDSPQGLGTGSLYTNNIESPLCVQRGTISYWKDKPWGSL